MIECTVYADRGLTRLAGLLPNGVATITRIAQGVPDTTLRNGVGINVTAGGVLLEDSEGPVGVPLTYQVDVTVADRIIQQNLVPTPSFMHGAQQWAAGSGRVLAVEGDPTAQHAQVGHFTNNAGGASLVGPPTLIGHVDGTPEVVGNYTLTPTTGGGSAIANGDWVYILHQQPASLTIGPAIPTGFTQVATGTGNSIKFAVWRRKRVAGDTGYLVKNAAGSTGIGTCFWVRGAGDAVPIISPLTQFQVGMATAVIVPSAMAVNPSLVVSAVAAVTTAVGPRVTAEGVFGQTFGWAVGNNPDTRSTLVTSETTAHAGATSQLTAVYDSAVQDVLAWQIIIPNTTPLTNRIVAKAKVTALPAAVTKPYRLTGRFRFTSTNVWLWDDVKNNGTWDDLLADKGTWADVLSSVVPGAGEYSRLFAAVVNPADGSYYVQPIQVLGFADTRVNTWLDFVIYFTPTLDIPATAEIWFIQGTYIREYSMEWYLDSIGITSGEQMDKHDTIWYLDGDTPRPAGAAAALDPDGGWTTPLDNSSVSWTETPGNSISRWLSPTALRGTTTCQIDWPQTETIPCEPVLVSDPVTSALGMWVGLLGISDLDHDVVSSDAKILGRADPVATSQSRQWETGSIRLMTTSMSDRNELLSIVRSGRIILLRNPDPDYPENNWYLSCKRMTELRLSPDHRFPHRAWDVPFTRVARPVGMIEASSATTWSAVANKWTWNQLKAQRATWLDVMTLSVD